MKKLSKMFLALLLAATLVIALIPATAAQGDYIDIPDPNFAEVVRWQMELPFGAPIPRARAAEMTVLSLDRSNISSLAGIEYFVALEWLYVRWNQLTELDLSNNPALQWVWASGSQLTKINISNNPTLERLQVDNNQLTALDLSNNQALTSLDVSNNQLNALDVSNNPTLRILNIDGNNLTTLDVSNNPLLEWLQVGDNNLTTLDVSDNLELNNLSVRGNLMKSLDDITGWQDNHNLILGETFIFYPQQDVPEPPPSPWATEYIERAVELGLVPARLNSFLTQAITRAEFTALVVALYETVTGREITGWWWALERFYDTNDINVQIAAAIGVVQGVGDGRFNPTGTLTREQAATMLARLAYAIGSPLPEQAATFADNDAVSYWAIDAVGKVQAAGIMGGVGDNMFSPQGSYTREQSIVTMLRLFDFVS